MKNIMDWPGENRLLYDILISKFNFLVAAGPSAILIGGIPDPWTPDP